MLLWKSDGSELVARLVGLGPFAVHRIAQADRQLELVGELLELSEALAHVLDAIAVLTDPATYPAVIQCSLGKDRTGVVIALVLRAIGVPVRHIVEVDPLAGRLAAEAAENQSFNGLTGPQQRISMIVVSEWAGTGSDGGESGGGSGSEREISQRRGRRQRSKSRQGKKDRQVAALRQHSTSLSITLARFDELEIGRAHV